MRLTILHVAIGLQVQHAMMHKLSPLRHQHVCALIVVVSLKSKGPKCVYICMGISMECMWYFPRQCRSWPHSFVVGKFQTVLTILTHDMFMERCCDAQKDSPHLCYVGLLLLQIQQCTIIAQT